MSDFPISRASWARLNKLIKRLNENEYVSEKELQLAMTTEVATLLTWVDSKMLRN